MGSPCSHPQHHLQQISSHIHTQTAPDKPRKRARGEGKGIAAAGGAEVGWNPHNARVRQVAVGRAGGGGRGRRVPEGTELLGVEEEEVVVVLKGIDQELG